ncbi:class IV adenylate cyclase [Hugenholtzia roseola]|uniref:class IV adenylate cyclase n=1 Tax=Hugenholtzia roseola TaxID=1002 RepID=UPI000426335F|nr:class IV adenylate cyclase [Hugenholtzia roseola]
MNEIEVKILEIDKNQVIEKLRRLGAIQTFEGELAAIYYDYPENTLGTEKKVLRLRKKGTTNELTFKAALPNSENSFAKEMQEEEVFVTDFEKMDLIIKHLGLVPIRSFSKKRTSFQYQDLHFEIDEYPNIPPLLEIEAQSKERLLEILSILGYNLDQTSNLSSFGILAHYQVSDTK